MATAPQKKQSEAEVGTLTSSQVREGIVEALRLDLVGPWPGHAYEEEALEGWVRPHNRYLTGFLIPSGTPPEKAGDHDEDDEFELVPEGAGLVEESSDDRKAAKKGYFPSSMGLSFLVGADTTQLAATIRWGEYDLENIEGKDGKPLSVWRRRPREETVSIRLAGNQEQQTRDVPRSDGLQVHYIEREVRHGAHSLDLPAGAKSVSVFLVNHREPDAEQPDRAFAFQAEIEVTSELPFVPRPDLRGATSGDWDDRVADLHYADTPEYATGHGVAADWETVGGDCRKIWTSWIPVAEVERTVTVPIEGVELSMNALGALEGERAVRDALGPLPARYRDWIAGRRTELDDLSGRRRETATILLDHAEVAAKRIERGIAILCEDADALDAFRVANRAVANALHKRLRVEEPAWRSFQLAFLLLNLPGMADPSDPHRDTVDLLFFPTGGGKTEAYLGLAAFAMVLRRLRHPNQDGLCGAGVSVLMRYTLRLLTLDQLGRATGLVCALELERERNAARYGTWPFEIGLWVGKAATPNRMGRRGDNQRDTARSKVTRFQQNPKGNPSPIPIEDCPWCGTRFEAGSFELLPDADRPKLLRVVCANPDCEFSGARALPIVAVDEPLYRRLPAFVIATLDKFASLPWVGPSGALLGGADRFDKDGFYGSAEPGHTGRLETPLPPPDLIIQDELHLIAGPLGTIAGLYETAIEALCLRELDGRTVRPKIVASTATVRHAQDQVQALFGRPLTQVFPPPGPSRRDAFFARLVPPSESNARQYLGVAAQGRNPKVMMRRVWLALMGAAQRAFLDAGGRTSPANPADPFMTVLGYFNSLRELGGARRILEEEVQNAVKGYGRRRRIGEDQGLFRDRKAFSEVVELTSRVSTGKVAEARRRLERSFHEKGHVDCAIATNMISVGLDIPRLGLMVVLGQPKTHAEYIQATSRVGRDPERPGLVATLLNVHKPRDRSHYERFRNYHETFYRSVEVSSVTPFAARAMDRGFAGALVALARHTGTGMAEPLGAERLSPCRRQVEDVLIKAFMDRVREQPMSDEDERAERLRSVQDRIVDLLDAWAAIARDYHSQGIRLQYQKYEDKNPRPLLQDPLDADPEPATLGKFRAARSMRDVEPEVDLFLRDLSGTAVQP